VRIRQFERPYEWRRRAAAVLSRRPDSVRGR
jgi:hypothetical protein